MPPGGIHAAKNGDRLDRYLSIAETVFVSQGFHGAAMAEIAELIGCSKGLLYHWFGSKDALFKAVILRQCVRHQAQIFASNDVEVRRYLSAVLLDLTMLLLRDDSLAAHRTMALESVRFPELSRTLLESGILRAEMQIAGFLRAAAADGRLKPCDPYSLAEQVVALALGEPYRTCLLCAAGPPPIKQITAHIQAAVDTVLKAYAREDASATIEFGPNRHAK